MKKRQGELSKAGVLDTHKPGSNPGSAILSWRNIFNTQASVSSSVQWV